MQDTIHQPQEKHHVITADKVIIVREEAADMPADKVHITILKTQQVLPHAQLVPQVNTQDKDKQVVQTVHLIVQYVLQHQHVIHVAQVTTEILHQPVPNAKQDTNVLTV